MQFRGLISKFVGSISRKESRDKATCSMIFQTKRNEMKLLVFYQYLYKYRGVVIFQHFIKNDYIQISYKTLQFHGFISKFVGSISREDKATCSMIKQREVKLNYFTKHRSRSGDFPKLFIKK